MWKQQLLQKKYEVQIAVRDANILRTTAKGQADAIRIRATGEASAIEVKGKAQAVAQHEITQTLTPKYLQYKAFDNRAASYYFVPVGKNGMPLIINAGGGHRLRPLRR